MAISPTEERQIILSRPQKRPYGAVVRVHVQTAGAFGRLDTAEIPLATGAFVTLAPARKAPWEGGCKYSLKLEGFPTAAAAEVSARRLVQAVLWMAVSTDVPIRLDYNSYDPFAVFERARSEGAQAAIYGESYVPADKVHTEIKDAYATFTEPDPPLLLSMEIFAGASLEASDRAKFLSIVSALEPLADEQPLGERVGNLVTSYLVQLKDTVDLLPEVQSSLEGRIRQLRTESIRQAIQRVVRRALPDQPNAGDTIDHAYALRSQIIHAGRPANLDCDLELERQAVSGIIRQVYARLLGRRLLIPPV